MTYLPVHPTMTHLLTIGQQLLVQRANGMDYEKMAVRATGISLHLRYLHHQEAILTVKPCMLGKSTSVYIDVDSILHLNDFEHGLLHGADYVAKYKKYALTEAAMAKKKTRPSHEELKARLDVKRLELYLPMPPTMRKALKVGQRVLFSGGTLVGQKRVISDVNVRCDMQTKFPNGGIETGTAFAHSREWFTTNVYMHIDDLAKYEHAYYVDQYKHSAVSELTEQGPTYDQLKIEKLEALDPGAPTEFVKKEWLAVEQVNMIPCVIRAETEEALLEILAARDSKHQFNIYYKTGEVNVKPAAKIKEKIIKFFMF